MELLGQAKNICIINYLAQCQKLDKFTAMSQPTILKLKFSKTGHAIITFRNFFVEKYTNEEYPDPHHIKTAFAKAQTDQNQNRLSLAGDELGTP